jgi:hypothetical protein
MFRESGAAYSEVVERKKTYRLIKFKWKGKLGAVGNTSRLRGISNRRKALAGRRSEAARGNASLGGPAKTIKHSGLLDKKCHAVLEDGVKDETSFR